MEPTTPIRSPNKMNISPYRYTPPPERRQVIIPETEIDSKDLPREIPRFKHEPKSMSLELEKTETKDVVLDQMKDNLEFFHVLEKLKLQKRTGWLNHRIPRAESISDHMYRMAMLAMVCPLSKEVDIGKAVMLCLVHDLAEATVGDITPRDNIPRAQKIQYEREAIEHFVTELLHDSPAGKRIQDLWEEYELGESVEAQLVKDLDRFELCLQAVEYERAHGTKDLQPFYNDSLPLIRHPRVRLWAEELKKERESLWTERGYEYRSTSENQTLHTNGSGTPMSDNQV